MCSKALAGLGLAPPGVARSPGLDAPGIALACGLVASMTLRLAAAAALVASWPPPPVSLA
jgi:hypothetical protein